MEIEGQKHRSVLALHEYIYMDIKVVELIKKEYLFHILRFSDATENFRFH